MLYLKHCPRCNGDLYRSSDAFGEYTSCLQCGFYRDLSGGSLAGIASGTRAEAAEPVAAFATARMRRSGPSA